MADAAAETWLVGDVGGTNARFGLVARDGKLLHSAVLASCVGVPSILFVYRSKCQDFMSSMDLDEFAVPLSEEDAYPAIRSRFERILSEPELRERIHQKALSWKRKQQARYQQIRAHIDVASRRV